VVDERSNYQSHLEDVSYIYEAGEFYLDINAIGDWSIEIEEKYQE